MAFGAHTRSQGPLTRACLIVLLATIASCSSGWAQSVRGTVLDRLTGMAVPGARVVLLEMDGRTHAATATDEAGAFVLDAPPGEYQLRADHVGYDEIVHQVTVPDSARLTIGLTPQPIVLGSLRATTRTRVPNLDRVGFYRRQDLGTGYFIDREQIERVAGGRILEALRGLPGVRMVPVLDGSGGHDVRMRAGCLASIIVDWHVVRRAGEAPTGGLDALPHPDLIEAIEVYPGPTGVPGACPIRGRRLRCDSHLDKAILITERIVPSSGDPGGAERASVRTQSGSLPFRPVAYDAMQVRHERRVDRFCHLHREATPFQIVEQTNTAAQNDGGDMNGEFIDQPCVQVLLNNVGTTLNPDVFAVRRRVVGHFEP